MTPDDLRRLRAHLQVSPSSLAKMVSVAGYEFTAEDCGAWERGDAEIPVVVARVLAPHRRFAPQGVR